MVKFCPDLFGSETITAIMAGQGDIVRATATPCLKEQCVAYDKETGRCKKYENEVEE